MKRRIKIITPERVLTALMEDNPTVQEFLSSLPLNLKLQDYNRTEKISDLPKRLTLKGAPEGYQPSAGDITIYGPWGNLAIFYNDFTYSRGLVLLGKLESGADTLKGQPAIDVHIELI